MADLIEMARELGRQIQQDERFINFRLAQDASDADEELQALIGEFNLKRIAISNEASNPERDDEKLQTLNKEMRSVYAKIMTNEHMMAYNDAKQAMDTLLTRVSSIIQQCAEGADPETADYSTPSCSGSCESCGGCG